MLDGLLPAGRKELRPHQGNAISIVLSSLGAGIPNAALVIVDEARIRGDMVDPLIDDRHDVSFNGLTATPWAKGMGLRWQDFVTPCLIADRNGLPLAVPGLRPGPARSVSGEVQNGDFVASGLGKLMGNAELGKLRGADLAREG